MSSGFSQDQMPFSDMSDVHAGSPAPRATSMKSPSAFLTISEVASNLAVPQHVLRFWESKFQQIRPLKRGGGRRYYRPEDVQLINNIKDLLYNQGFTIRGVQKLLKESGRSSSARAMVAEPQVPATFVAPVSSMSTGMNASVAHSHPPQSLSTEKRREIESILVELKALRALLKQSGI